VQTNIPVKFRSLWNSVIKKCKQTSVSTRNANCNTVIWQSFKPLNHSPIGKKKHSIVGPQHTHTHTPLQAWNVACVRRGRVKRKMAASLYRSTNKISKVYLSVSGKSYWFPSPIRSIHMQQTSVSELRETSAMLPRCQRNS